MSGYGEFGVKNRYRSIFVRGLRGYHQIVRKNIGNTRICPKKNLDSPDWGGASPMKLDEFFFVNKSLTGGSPFITW